MIIEYVMTVHAIHGHTFLNVSQRKCLYLAHISISQLVRAYTVYKHATHAHNHFYVSDYTTRGSWWCPYLCVRHAYDSKRTQKFAICYQDLDQLK